MKPSFIVCSHKVDCTEFGNPLSYLMSVLELLTLLVTLYIVELRSALLLMGCHGFSDTMFCVPM